MITMTTLSFTRLTAARRPSSPLTVDLTFERLTVPSEPSSVANTAMHFQHRQSMDPPGDTPARAMRRRSPSSSSRSLHPSALQPRHNGASHHLKDSEHHHRVEHHFTPPTRHPAPHHHCLLVSAPFQPLPAHRPRPLLVFIRRDSRTFPRTFIRQRYKDSWTHWTLHLHFILCFIYFCISREHDLCI